MGGKAVRIELGDANTHLESKDTIKGVFIPDMITMLSSEIMPLKEMASELLGNMNKTINNINTIFDSTSVDNLKNSIEKFNRTMSNAQKLSDALAKSSPELEEMLANLNILSGSLKDGAGDIKSSLSNINQITTTLSEAELEATIENLKNLIAKMQDPNGTIGKLLTTEDMHNSLNTLLKDVDILVNKISENPKKYIKISVF
jgi:ABC-type transport system involved in resistance to organic solvents, periplasmic component